jgi:predicted alpha/beta-fold hydrolase
LPSTIAALRANPKVRLLETAHGGHCGFLAEANGYDGRWAERQIVEFFAGAIL